MEGGSTCSSCFWGGVAPGVRTDDQFYLDEEVDLSTERKNHAVSTLVLMLLIKTY